MNDIPSFLTGTLATIEWTDCHGERQSMPAQKLQETVRGIVSQNNRLRELMDVADRMRPHWAQGYSSDSHAAQVTCAALSEVWDMLGVKNQTECMAKLNAFFSRGVT